MFHLLLITLVNSTASTLDWMQIPVTMPVVPRKGETIQISNIRMYVNEVDYITRNGRDGKTVDGPKAIRIKVDAVGVEPTRSTLEADGWKVME